MSIAALVALCGGCNAGVSVVGEGQADHTDDAPQLGFDVTQPGFDAGHPGYDAGHPFPDGGTQGDAGPNPACARRTTTVSVRGHLTATDRFLGGVDGITVVGDCDGDGRIDFLNHDVLHVASAGDGFSSTMLDNMSGVKAGTMSDIDRDGALDLVLAGTQGVAWRRGDGRCGFGPPQTISDDGAGEPSQVRVSDVDLDGLADITIARQERRDVAFQLYLGRGDGRFVDVTQPPTPMAMHLDQPFRSFVSFYDDVDNDGAMDFFAIVDNDLGWFSWGTPGDALAFTQDPTITRSLTGISPMSVSPIDHDRDGTLEYFVTGVFGVNRLYHADGRTVVDQARAACLAEGNNTSDDLWASLSGDANLDGADDLLLLAEPDDHHSGGFVQLLVNQRDGTFALAPDVVVHENFQATSMVCADFDVDGREDCLVRDSSSRALTMLRNALEPEGHWVGVRLHGTVSSPDATGARVTLDGATPPRIEMVGGQSPTAGEHDPAVVFAVGDAARAAVTITWPSGLRQRVGDLAAGAYTTVTEPAVLQVSRRVAPADGAAEVAITVDPGLVNARAVQIDCTGACAWTGAAAMGADGRWVRTLRAPATPGEARVRVTLDGAALRVRPRVRFEAPST